jgi:4-amino-4-deoxy-L-arabinose transferase-like glycosyltransferase
VVKVGKFLLVGLILAGMGIFFSYRILEVPSGLTADEAAFGYNATLLSQTAHDENGRFLPVFVLSINGVDWRQPVTMYYLTGLYKIFGPSVFLLRFSSVIITLISGGLMFMLGKKMVGTKWAVLPAAIFLTTPLVMIQSHMGLDNIMPVPFTILWLLGLVGFSQTKNRKYLIMAGVSMGIAFYTYKGMRATVPVWCILTVIYLAWNWWNKPKSRKEITKNIASFALAVMPFFAIIPLLEAKYPGAVFDKKSASLMSIYDFVYPYFSSFDPTFLFIKGDATLYHSTQIHGMMLLSTAPLFAAGVYFAIRKKGMWLLVLAGFLGAPLLFGWVGSVHRASRLMSMIPEYCMIATWGMICLWEKKKMIIQIAMALIVILMLINYGDFVNYYWYSYPKFTENLFSRLDYYKSYERFAQISREGKLMPYVETDVAKFNEICGKFFEAMYFSGTKVGRVPSGDLPPARSLLLTQRKEIPGMERVNTEMPKFYLQKMN